MDKDTEKFIKIIARYGQALAALTRDSNFDVAIAEEDKQFVEKYIDERIKAKVRQILVEDAWR